MDLDELGEIRNRIKEHTNKQKEQKQFRTTQKEKEEDEFVEKFYKEYIQNTNRLLKIPESKLPLVEQFTRGKKDNLVDTSKRVRILLQRKGFVIEKYTNYVGYADCEFHYWLIYLSLS